MPVKTGASSAMTEPQTRKGSLLWCKLLIVCISLTFANGPMMSWQTLVPAMLSDGAFGG